MSACIFHVDMDAFYASIEQRDQPAYRGRALVVGGHGRRAVVAAASYEARKHGVRSAMPMAEALRRCPDLVVVNPRMKRYRDVSQTVMSILSSYSPDVRAISIDEAFLDMTGTERLMGPPRDIAQNLKNEVREATKLAISIGIGTSRFIAKLASDVDKPDGLFEVEPGSEEDFVASLDIGALWGVGASTRRRLAGIGIDSVLALRETRDEVLRGHFGQAGATYLRAVAHGRDPGVHPGHRARRSISAETTFEQDIAEAEEVNHYLLDLCDEVVHRSIVEDWWGPSIQVKYRFPPFETHTVSKTIDRRITSGMELSRIAEALLTPKRAGRPLRLLGVGMSGDSSADKSGQQDLFAPAAKDTLDPVIVAIRNRFGSDAIGRAGHQRRGRSGDESQPGDEA